MRVVYRERPASIQAQGSDGRHHQEVKRHSFLPEAGSEASHERSFGEEASPKEESQRTGLIHQPWAAR